MGALTNEWRCEGAGRQLVPTQESQWQPFVAAGAANLASIGDAGNVPGGHTLAIGFLRDAVALLATGRGVPTYI